MNDNEKRRRCEKAFNESTDPKACNFKGHTCKVYGRSVGMCSDCAFSTKWDHMIIRIMVN